MLPILRGMLSSQSVVKVHLTQNEKSVQQLPFPVFQVSNAQDLPSTSECQQVETQTKVGAINTSVEHQRKVLNLLLNLLFEQQKLGVFEADKNKIEALEPSNKREIYYYSKLIIAIKAINELLFKIKKCIIDLIMIEGTLKIKKEIRSRALFSLIKSLIKYSELANVFANETTTQVVYKSKWFHSLDRIKKVHAELNNNEARYKAVLESKIAKDPQIKIKIFRHYGENWFLKTLTSAFIDIDYKEIESQVLNKLEMLEPSRESNLLSQAQPSTPSSEMPHLSASLPSINLSQASSTLSSSASFVPLNVPFVASHEILKEFRPKVDRNFWRLFDEKLDTSQYSKIFHEFMLTSWDVESCYDLELTKRLTTAEKQKNLAEQYEILSKKCFQKQLKIIALLFIKQILIIKEYVSEKKIYEKKEESLNEYKLKTLVKYLFIFDCKKPYDRYQERKNAFHKLNEKILPFEINKINTWHETAKKRIKRLKDQTIFHNINSNLHYISQVLKILRSNKTVKGNDIIFLAERYSEIALQKQESLSYQSKLVQRKRFHDASQVSHRPAAKRATIEQEVSQKSLAFQNEALCNAEIMPAFDQKRANSQGIHGSEQDFLLQNRISEQKSPAQSAVLNFEPSCSNAKQTTECQPLPAEALVELFPELSDLFSTATN